MFAFLLLYLFSFYHNFIQPTTIISKIIFTLSFSGKFHALLPSSPLEKYPVF